MCPFRYRNAVYNFILLYTTAQIIQWNDRVYLKQYFNNWDEIGRTNTQTESDCAPPMLHLCCLPRAWLLNDTVLFRYFTEWIKHTASIQNTKVVKLLSLKCYVHYVVMYIMYDVPVYDESSWWNWLCSAQWHNYGEFKAKHKNVYEYEVDCIVGSCRCLRWPQCTSPCFKAQRQFAFCSRVS